MTDRPIVSSYTEREIQRLMKLLDIAVFELAVARVVANAQPRKDTK